MNQIIVFRYGHRLERDKRITTHCALVGRAFSAEKMIYCGQEDPNIQKNVEGINKRFGGNFAVEYVKNWQKKLEELKKEYTIVHLTMYGLELNDFISENNKKKSTGNICIVVGSEKVPPFVYQIADYNVSVTNQPHSEVAALAICLDRLNPDYLKKSFVDKHFKNGLLCIKPNNKGKTVLPNK